MLPILLGGSASYVVTEVGGGQPGFSSFASEMRIRVLCKPKNVLFFLFQIDRVFFTKPFNTLGNCQSRTRRQSSGLASLDCYWPLRFPPRDDTIMILVAICKRSRCYIPVLVTVGLT